MGVPVPPGLSPPRAAGAGVRGQGEEHRGRGAGAGPAAAQPPQPLLRAGDPGPGREVLHRPGRGQEGARGARGWGTAGLGRAETPAGLGGQGSGGAGQKWGCGGCRGSKGGLEPPPGLGVAKEGGEGAQVWGTGGPGPPHRAGAGLKGGGVSKMGVWGGKWGSAGLGRLGPPHCPHRTPLCPPQDYPKNRHPGWSRGSVAYHAGEPPEVGGTPKMGGTPPKCRTPIVGPPLSPPENPFPIPPPPILGCTPIRRVWGSPR